MKETAFTCLFVTCILWSCQSRNESMCFPNTTVAKTVILVADTTILGRYFIPDNDTTKTYSSYDGIGFVRPNGLPVHQPLKELTLTKRQQQEFSKLLRPLQSQSEGMVTSCLPVFRHVVLFYNNVDSLVGQMHICFNCNQVVFKPAVACLDFFGNHRMPELKRFFLKNNIPLLEEN